MLWGYNTNGFAHHRLTDALRIIAELGYRSVALTLEHHALDPLSGATLAQVPAVRDLLGELKLRLVVETGARFLLDPWRKHQPTLVSERAVDRQRRLDFLRRAIDIAALLQADAVSFWSGRALDDAPSETLLDRLVAGCRTLADHAAGSNVRLAFEPEPGMFIDTMDRFAEVHARVDHPAFGLTLDIGHLHCLGETPIVNYLRRWRHWLWNVHLEDMRRGVHEHLMFGEGEIDFREVVAALQEIEYPGGAHVELSRHSHEAPQAARRALEFLRNIPTRSASEGKGRPR